MIVYDIKLYDPKTDTVNVVFTLPERRRDPNRPRGTITIQNLAKSLLGNEWWSKNWHNISITERNGGRDGDSLPSTHNLQSLNMAPSNYLV